MKILDRYASAVFSGNLKAKDASVMGDTDVLGAMGLADKALITGRHSDGTPCRPAPLAVALERLFTGDNGAAFEIVQMLADQAMRQAGRLHVKIKPTQALRIAQACLAWHRNGACRPCGGLGQTLMPGSRSLSGHDCQVCRGTGKVLFEKQFRQEHQELARWLLSEMTRETGRAGPAAMQKLADKGFLDL